MTSRTSLLIGVAALAIALSYTAVADSYAVFLIATISLTAIACIGLNVLLGLAGQISLGHIGFMAIGAYTTVLLMEKAGWPYLAATGAGIVLVSIIGGLLAMPALRVRGPYLAMVTIAFGFIVEHGTIEWRDLTGGGNGLVLTVPPSIFGMPLSERGLAIASVALMFARRHPVRPAEARGWGYAMRAARDSEVATRSVGIDLVRVRTMAFVISAAAMALAGSLFAPLQGYISPSSFPFLQSILLLFGVMIGGAGSALGRSSVQCLSYCCPNFYRIWRNTVCSRLGFCCSPFYVLLRTGLRAWSDNSLQGSFRRRSDNPVRKVWP